MSETTTKQTENSGAAYLLTEGERGVMRALHIGVVNAKVAVYEAQEHLKAAEAEITGALGMLANSHGVGGGRLTPDFSAILKQQGVS